MLYRLSCGPIRRPSFFPRTRRPSCSFRLTHTPRPSISAVVDQAADLLPNQAILENFIHNNPLKNFEWMNFKEAIDHVQKLESYMSPGERILLKVDVDPRKRVNEALVDLCSVFLDRGAAKWAPQFRDRGFLYFFASLEGLGFSLWRKRARQDAKKILALLERGEDSRRLAETVLQENLEFYGIPPKDWTFAIRSILLELRGWAGMVHEMETHPDEAPPNTRVSLLEFCAVQMILGRSSIEALGDQLEWTTSTKQLLSDVPVFRDHEHSLHASAISYVDQYSEARETLETQFQHTLLSTIGNKPTPKKETQGRPDFQLYTCIDDRECSFRRYVEEASPEKIETFGVAGFFGIPIKYKPMDGINPMILAPQGQNPSDMLVEQQADPEKAARFTRRRKLVAQLSLMWENASFSAIGSLFISLLAPLSLGRILLMGLFPSSKRTLKDNMLQEIFLKFRPKTDFQLPSPQKQAAQVASTLKDIGTQNRFAPLVVVLGHGSISVNNPFAAAYNCGACGGREGGPNARLMARLANDKIVRMYLAKDHDIHIPDDTWFIGGLHNTTADTVQFYDVDLLPDSHRPQFDRIKEIINNAAGKNALERCHRFFLAKNIKTPEEALWHVKTRSSDAAEVRPELNHATNAAVFIGRRGLTKGKFLDRRVFLPSYDPFGDDDKGTNLEHVLGPALNVCSGINLEYLFSTIHDHHGAGTKSPLNIVGNIGVLQGTMGDLRPGLPSQMTEMHTPIRALFIVDAPIQRVEAVLARRKELLQIVRNEWVRFFVRDPETGCFYKQENGDYIPFPVRELDYCHVPFKGTTHYRHASHVTLFEDIIYRTAFAGMILSCLIPVYLFSPEIMNPRGAIIAAGATLLSLPVLAFARRYLHGERMFTRFAVLCSGLLIGFNLVATAPSLAHILAGWSLFGFASTFLIGAYNDRPTVRNNATFAFSVYKLSDLALLLSVAFGTLDALGHENPELAAGGLLLAALLKSSQFPLVSLFARSMEGPTPASALGYAGLSAHVGIVLLTSTLPLWFGFDWARIALGSVGLFTAGYASLLMKVRADRKGAIANATSATLGLIFFILALGYSDLALILAFGHAAFRMTQTLRAPNIISDTQKLTNALGFLPWPKIVPDWLYKFIWRLHRFNTDLNFLHLLHMVTRRVVKPAKTWHLSKFQQWCMTSVIVVLAGAPFTPLSHHFEEFLIELLKESPNLAASLMFVHFSIAVILIRILFVKVLNPLRFKQINS